MWENQRKKITIAFIILFVIIFLCATWFTIAVLMRKKIMNLDFRFATSGINFQPVESLKISGFPFNFIIVLKDQKVGIEINDKKIDLQFPEVKIKSNIFLTKNEINWGKQFVAIHENNQTLMSSSDHIRMKINFALSPFFAKMGNVKAFYDNIALFNLLVENFNFTFDNITNLLFNRIDLKFGDGKIENQKTKKLSLNITTNEEIWSTTLKSEYYKNEDLIKFAIYDFTNKTNKSSLSLKGKGSINDDFQPSGEFMLSMNNITDIASGIISLSDLYKNYPENKEMAINIFDIIAKIENNTGGKIKININDNKITINDMGLHEFIDSIPSLKNEIERLQQNIVENYSNLNNTTENTKQND